ncbi:TPA: winged helix-turn-helix domain-containing protein [Serratia fonticola]
MKSGYLLNGNVEFWPDEHRLVACAIGRSAIALNTPTSRCLELLVQRRYELVPQQDFYDYVWGEGGNSVPANTLYQNIALVRKALRNVAPGFEEAILTVPKRGFKLNETCMVTEIDERQQDIPLFRVTPVDQQVATDPEIAIVASDIAEPPSPLPAMSKTSVDPVLPASALHKPHPNRGIYGLGVLFIVLLLVAVGMSYTFGTYFVSSSYFVRYSDKHIVNECTFYTHPGIGDVTEILNEAATLPLDCKTMPYVYVTSIGIDLPESLLTCDRPFGTPTTPECVLFHLLKAPKS